MNMKDFEKLEQNTALQWSDDYRERYQRNIGVLEIDEQEKLRNTKICCIGVGGTGGVPTEVLARSGIGAMNIVDIDIYDISNVNRQIYATQETVGMKKVDAAKQRLLDINPNMDITTFDEVTQKNIEEVIGGCNVVIIAADDNIVRILVARKAEELKIPLVDSFGPLTYANVNVIMPGDASYEDQLGLSTQNMTIEELYADHSRNHSIVMGQMAAWSMGVEGMMGLYSNDLYANLAAGLQKPRSFAPLVFMSGALIAMETIKIIINRENTELSRSFRYYDPWRNRIPQTWNVKDKYHRCQC